MNHKLLLTFDADIDAAEMLYVLNNVASRGDLYAEGPWSFRVKFGKFQFDVAKRRKRKGQTSHSIVVKRREYE